MNKGETLWVFDNGAWAEAAYEFRCVDQEPLGYHSVMLRNGGGRRVVPGDDTSMVFPPVPTARDAATLEAGKLMGATAALDEVEDMMRKRSGGSLEYDDAGIIETLRCKYASPAKGEL